MKKIMKKLVTLVLAVVMAIPVMGITASAALSDVAEYDSIYTAAITNGGW
jgi:hypothetical protein